MVRTGTVTRLLQITLLAAILVGSHHQAMAASSCPVVEKGPLPAEAIPTPKADAGWQDHVNTLNGQIAHTDLSRVRTLFLGDSLTESWAPPLFGHFYGHRAPLNLGVSGDNTQGLLWRLARVPLGTQLRPQLVILLIGTNDLWPGANPANVAAGIGEVVNQIRQRAPQSHILLVGLLPRGENPDDPFRQLGTAVNGLIAHCADPMVTYVDPGEMLLDGQGQLTKDINYDYLHLTWVGYAILGAALEPYVHRIIGN